MKLNKKEYEKLNGYISKLYDLQLQVEDYIGKIANLMGEPPKPISIRKLVPSSKLKYDGHMGFIRDQYEVVIYPDNPSFDTCTCPDHKIRKRACKHIQKVRDA